MTHAEAEAYVDSLGRDYIEMKATFEPHWATAMGIPGHDGDLARYRGQGVSRPLRRVFGIKRKLTSFSEDSLSISTWVDQQLLLAEIQTLEYWFSGQVAWRRSPLPYTDAIIEGIASLMLSGREDSLSEYLALRLGAIPDVVEDARTNVTDPIKLHCEVAAADLRGFLPALDIESVEAEPALDPEVVTDELLAEARSSIEEFAAFIDSLAVRGEATYALGAEEYSAYLNTAFMMEEPLENIISEAEQTLDQAKEKSQASPGRQDPLFYYVGEGGPLPEYEAAIRALLREIGGRGLLHLTPADSSLDVRAAVPLVPLLDSPVYRPPVPAAGRIGALYLQTPVPGQAAGRMYSNWRWAEPVHSRYPASHPAAVRLLMHPSAIRRHVRNEVGRRGWELYFRGLVGQPVPIREAESVSYWSDLAYHAAAAIAEIRIHAGEWTVDDAADFIAGETGRDPEAALRDARRYAVAPGSGIAYLLGRREILRLRERYKKVKRNSFDLKEFHDTLLSCGYLPPYLLSIEVMSKGMGRE